MPARWSMHEECFVYDCVYGCHVSDFESMWEAEQAELAHDCKVPAA